MGDLNPWEEPAQAHTELFDVVLVKEGAYPHSAEPEQLKRVTVEASSTLAARSAPEVEAEKGWRPFQVTTPGVSTPEEVNARQRRILGEQPTFDRSKV